MADGDVFLVRVARGGWDAGVQEQAVRRTDGRWWCGLLAGWCAVLGGCHAEPKTLRAVELQTPAARAEAAEEYWAGRGSGGLDAGRHRRVVITEFVLEFVTEKRESGGLISDRQKIVDVPTGFLSAGVMASGLKRKVIEYEDEMCRQLPDVVFRQVRAGLQAGGFEVLPSGRVVGAAAYQGFETEAEGRASLLKRINVFSSDTGRVLAARRYPADGLQVIRAARGGDEAAVERALLAELGADVSLRIRFRLGIFDDRVSIERGSAITVTRADGAGVWESRRSLLSDVQVVTDDGFMPVAGKVLQLNEAAYRSAVERLAEAYFGLALEASEGAREREGE